MPDHRVGTREDWLAARLELLEAEKKHFRRGDEIARMRRELPWVPIRSGRFTARSPAGHLVAYKPGG